MQVFLEILLKFHYQVEVFEKEKVVKDDFKNCLL